MPIIAAKQRSDEFGFIVVAMPRRFEVYDRINSYVYDTTQQSDFLIVDVAISENLVFVLRRKKVQNVDSHSMIEIYDCIRNFELKEKEFIK